VAPLETPVSATQPTAPAPRPSGGRFTGLLLSVWLGGALVGGCASWFFFVGRLERDPDVARYRAIRDFVQRFYVREVDSPELLDHALHGMVESLDGYSRYYDQSQIAAIERDTTGVFRGIGVVFKQPIEDNRVLFAMPGSPADRAGLGPGDRIVSLGGRAATAMAPGEIQNSIASSDAEVIELGVVGRDGAARTLQVTRSEIVDPTVRHVAMLDDPLGIGYLAITSFSQETLAEFDAGIKWLQSQGMRALVLDLRGNLGGVLSSAVHIANRFVAEGLIVSTEGRGETMRYPALPDQATLAGLGVIVLVDQESASASEVLAAALQDHRAAVIVGSPTYGKGMVQKVKSFGAAEAEVKLTTAYYYTPAHRNIERTVRRAWDIGLAPDVTVVVSAASSNQLHEYLSTYGAPLESLDRLRAWERDEGITLIPERPKDAQLEVGLALLRGEKPGPQPLQRSG
jgi:carboxyl-terminal processing protease